MTEQVESSEYWRQRAEYAWECIDQLVEDNMRLKRELESASRYVAGMFINSPQRFVIGVEDVSSP